MEKLKTALSSAPALKPLVYMPEDDGFVGGIVLGVDAGGLDLERFCTRRIGRAGATR